MMVSKIPQIPPNTNDSNRKNNERYQQNLKTIPGAMSTFSQDLMANEINSTGKVPQTKIPLPTPRLTPPVFNPPPSLPGQTQTAESINQRPIHPQIGSAFQSDHTPSITTGEWQINELLVNRYQITQKIGQGGMGQVFLAQDTRLNRQVVVKVSHSQGDGPSAEDRARFEREALKMASLNHPNIVTIYDYGEHNGDQFLVMELIKGETLKTFINHPDSMNPRLFKEIMTQLLKGVQDAHDHDVIHRDLKPSNLMWDGDRKILKILDFGLARGVEGDTVTGTGHVHGSIQYMAPEQIRGENQGPTTDIYAIGILCFQLLSKALPFRGENTVELMFQKLQKDPHDLLEQDKTPAWVTNKLAQVIRGCLYLEQEKRPSSALECLELILATLPQENLSQLESQTIPQLDSFSAGPKTSVVSSQVHTNHFVNSQKERIKSFLVYSLSFLLVLNLLWGQFFSENSPENSLDKKTASVYLTSVDSLTGIESQVELSLDGVVKGVTPLKLEVVPGQHEVSLKHQQWHFKKTYNLKKGESYWYSLPAPPSITLDLPAPTAPIEPQIEIEEETPEINQPTVKSSSKKRVVRKKRRPKRKSSKFKKTKRRKKLKNKKANSVARTSSRRNKKTNKSSAIKKKSSKKKATSKPKPKPKVDVPLFE